jgi:hypothetical protein
MLPATHVASHACHSSLALAPPAMRCSTRPPRAQPAQGLLSPSLNRVQPVPRLLCPSHPLCTSFPHPGASFALPKPGVLVEPARLEAPCRLQHTGQGGQCLMSTGRCRQALARAHAGARALGRMRTSQERQPAAALHTLRLLPGLTTSATSTTSTSPQLHLLPAPFSRESPRLPAAARQAIPVSGWQGGLLGSGPRRPGAPRPLSPLGFAGPSRSIAAELLWRYAGPAGTHILFFSIAL